MKVASRTIVQIKPEKQKEVDSFMKDKAGQISSTQGLITWGYINTGENEITSKKVKDAITLMKVTSLLFFGIVSVPIILFISFVELILFA